MIYLHKSVFQSHGYLCSANCHVDNRWVLKISGFSLHPFRKQHVEEQVNLNFQSYFLCSEYDLLGYRCFRCTVPYRNVVYVIMPRYFLIFSARH